MCMILLLTITCYYLCVLFGWVVTANLIDSLTLIIKISLLLFYVSPNFIGTATHSKFIA